MVKVPNLTYGEFGIILPTNCLKNSKYTTKSTKSSGRPNFQNHQSPVGQQHAQHKFTIISIESKNLECPKQSTLISEG
jgi:hypothetical protein